MTTPEVKKFLLVNKIKKTIDRANEVRNSSKVDSTNFSIGWFNNKNYITDKIFN